MPHRFTRAELYDLVWAEPRKTLTNRFAVSDVAIAKACRKHDIPMPERGYWARLKAGRRVFQPTLPPRGPGMEDQVVIGGRYHWRHRSLSEEEILASEPQAPVFERAIEEVVADVRKMVGRVTVPKNFQRAHHLVRKLLEEDEERKEKAKGERYVMSWEKPQFESPFERRRLRLLSAIFNALQKQGMRPWVRGREARDLVVDINQTYVPFWLDDANAEVIWHAERYQPCRNPSGRLKMVIQSGSSEPNGTLVWEDSKTEKIEQFATDIVVELIVSGERRYRKGELRSYKWQLERKADIIEKRRREKEEAERLERERIARLEQERIDRLLADAQALRQARDIRAYVQEVTELCAEESGHVSQEALREWREWALAQADRIDPVVSGGFRKSMEDPTDDAPES